MFIMVAGCGRLGAGLARILSSQGHDVVVVGEDIDPRHLGAEFDGLMVAGNPLDEELLGNAGIGKADLFVAATADDRLNAMAVQIVRESFHVPMTLARISDPALEVFYRGIGLDTVCPTSTSIDQILDLIRGKGDAR
jgi:trk system potassium uptake protein TrkA